MGPDPVPDLHLLRHVKSRWSAPGVGDHDRALAPRGERAAAALAIWLRQQGFAPDLILCSTARRARDTLTAIAAGVPAGTPVQFEAGLYEAAAGDLLRSIRRVGPGTGSLLLVAHNPGLEDLAARLAGPEGDRKAARALGIKFPTGGFVRLECDGDWATLADGRARLVEFAAPKDLV